VSEDLSPQEKRARLERSYAESYRRAGIEGVDVPRQVLADLELVDSVRAAGELNEGGEVGADPSRVRYDHDEIREAEAETHTRIVRDGEERGESVVFLETDANPMLTSEKWASAGGRVMRILEGMGASSDFRVACRSAAMPELAREYAETYWFFMTRIRPAPVGQTDHNPFRFLSDADAVRMLVAKVYSICDRSTGKFGHWYVK
jgi:hypothetical protein